MLFTAFQVTEDAPGWRISPASYQRQLMDDTPGRGAYRCLPLSMANQAGWFVHSPFSFRAVWNGGVGMDAITLTFPENADKAALTVLSHFGCGIVTFRLPFLFRTPPGIGLLVRGAPNWPVINFAALEGLVETDWNPATFTMNWKIMEPNREVQFEKEWPVCFIQPFDLNLPEKLVTERKPVRECPGTEQDYRAWWKSRQDFLLSEAKDRGEWQKDYFQGVDAEGANVKTHRTNFRLAKFEE